MVRLTKLAYPEFNTTTRERMAIQSLTNAIPDRDAVFYIEEKNPGSIDEVCELLKNSESSQEAATLPNPPQSKELSPRKISPRWTYSPRSLNTLSTPTNRSPS